MAPRLRNTRFTSYAVALIAAAGISGACAVMSPQTAAAATGVKQFSLKPVCKKAGVLGAGVNFCARVHGRFNWEFVSGDILRKRVWNWDLNWSFSPNSGATLSVHHKGCGWSRYFERYKFRRDFGNCYADVTWKYPKNGGTFRFTLKYPQFSSDSAGIVLQAWGENGTGSGGGSAVSFN